MNIKYLCVRHPDKDLGQKKMGRGYSFFSSRNLKFDREKEIQIIMINVVNDRHI